ncbi:MAG: hypothetical protein KGQ46_12360 [Hyphomicrobiales bacterium]|nr:hypothetical protein [Hyphomicrobiales bacterium]MDE2113847.1 hypothetical protein [Hyphomicrobiales bacterium]
MRLPIILLIFLSGIPGLAANAAVVRSAQEVLAHNKSLIGKQISITDCQMFVSQDQGAACQVMDRDFKHTGTRESEPLGWILFDVRTLNVSNLPNDLCEIPSQDPDCRATATGTLVLGARGLMLKNARIKLDEPD